MSSTTMTFYEENRVDGKKEFTYEELINRFILDETAYKNFLYGWPFDRAFLVSMPGTPESVLISDDDWDALWKEFKRQVPEPEYKG